METKNTVVDRKSESASGKPAETGKPAEKPAETVKSTEPELVAKPESEMEKLVREVCLSSKSRAGGGKTLPRAGVGYALLPDGVRKLVGTNIPEQEQVLLRILARATTPENPVINEVELEKLVVAAKQSGALKTRQDAWHIFRYYRTDMVKRNALRQVDLTAAPETKAAA